jgi:calmodulin
MRELGLNPSPAELNDLVSEADLNSDGVISFDGKNFSPFTFL